MSSVDPEVPFAFWLDPATSATVSYSLPLFHEIDFQVNEGYRRIPHGGVDVGGLLYGRIRPDSVTIEASQPIDCEHASGPSFHLSDRDLANLQEAILAAPKNDDLQGLEPVGWFIAHTRGPLRMTDREVELFGRFFPEPSRLTVLVKPERFKPTRFVFLVRGATGAVNPDGEASAIILPLPGRAGKAVEGAAASIPAPQPQSPEPVANGDKPVARTVVPISRPAPAEQPDPDAAIAPAPVHEERPESTASSDLSTPPPAKARKIEAAPEKPHSKTPKARKGRAWGLIVVLILAALLGCSAGYWAYLQLPPPIIELRVQKESNNLLVVWDPAQTQTARYAVIRVNNGFPALLTPEQKASGIAQVPLAGDSVEIEIVAQHWARESRGIVRFVPARPATGEASPGALPSRQPTQ